MANTITTLIGAGHDAFTNLYDVEITLPNALANSTVGLVDEEFLGETFTSKILTRIGNFQPPASSLGEYQTFYQSGSITRQNAKIAVDRVIQLPIRLDGSYDLYRIFKKWQGLYIGANQADYRLPNPNIDYDYFGSIALKSFNSESNPVSPVTGSLEERATWYFENVVCTEVGEPAFARGSTNPIEVQVSFLYYIVISPTDPT